LQYSLRDIASTNLNTNDADSEPKCLSELGITIDSSGSMSVSDSDKLLEVLKSDPKKVSRIFIGEGGFVDKLQASIKPFEGETGLIKARTNSLNSQIDQTQKRTNDVSDRIDNQAENLRKQYTSYLQLLYKAQAQSNTLSTGGGMDTSGYNSLLGG
jgi:flagellar capping protein FliD